MQGKKTRPKRDERPEWAHELFNDFLNHEKFTEECLEINDKRGVRVPFVLQPAQRKLNEIVERCKEQNRPVRIIVLKARQVMISTGTAAHFFHEVPFEAGQKALIVAHQEDAAQNIFTYYHQLQENFKPFRRGKGVVGLPKLVQDAEDAGEMEWANGSWIHIATANNVKSGRSYSLRYLHLSEYAFWRDARTLMTGLMQAVPHDAHTMVVIESTANGVGGDFYQRWLEANDPASGSEWIPLFFAWWEHPEYSMPLRDPAAFQETLTGEEIDLQQRYNLRLEQLAWRRWCIRNNCGGSVDSFKQEYPSCPEEAFLFSGRPRFSHQHLNRMPVDRAGAVGELETTVNGPHRVIHFLPKEHGMVTIYRRPAPHHQYSIGVDVCEGIDAGEGVLGAIDPDWTVADVYDRDTGEQVAIFRARLEPAPAAQYVAVLGRWYANSETGNPAFIVPEANGPGIAFIEELMRQEYPPGQIYHRRPSPEEQFSPDANSVASKLGWKTTQVTRVQLISKLDAAIREFGIIFRSPRTVTEHTTFVIHPNGKAAAMEGCHDDCVIAAGLGGVIGIEQAPPDRRANATKPFRGPAAPDGKPPASTTSYGKRRLPDRGQLVRI